MSSTPTDLDGLRRLIALKTPNQEQEPTIKIQTMSKGWGRQQDEDYYILIENVLKIHTLLLMVRLNAYHQPQAEYK
jgi:hypothetical protein